MSPIFGVFRAISSKTGSLMSVEESDNKVTVSLITAIVAPKFDTHLGFHTCPIPQGKGRLAAVPHLYQKGKVPKGPCYENDILIFITYLIYRQLFLCPEE